MLLAVCQATSLRGDGILRQDGEHRIWENWFGNYRTDRKLAKVVAVSGSDLLAWNQCVLHLVRQPEQRRVQSMCLKRRVVSTGQCNTCLQFIRRSLKSQSFSWTLI